MKFATLAILALLSFTAVNTQARKRSFKGCIAIKKVYYKEECSICYQRKFKTDGSNLCGAAQPASDGCAYYIHDDQIGSRCIQCKPGYTLSIGINRAPACVQGAIQNCVVEKRVGISQICQACDNGLYPKPVSDGITPCGSIPHPDPHCLWGCQGRLPRGDVFGVKRVKL